MPLQSPGGTAGRHVVGVVCRPCHCVAQSFCGMTRKRGRPQHQHAPEKRRRQRQRACDACRAAHAACSHEPTCASCADAGRVCVYSSTIARASASASAPAAASGVDSVAARHALARLDRDQGRSTACASCATAQRRCDSTSPVARMFLGGGAGCLACYVIGKPCSVRPGAPVAVGAQHLPAWRRAALQTMFRVPEPAPSVLGAATTTTTTSTTTAIAAGATSQQTLPTFYNSRATIAHLFQR